jgi:hypothetical protein
MNTDNTATAVAPAARLPAPKSIESWQAWLERFKSPEGTLEEKIGLVKQGVRDFVGEYATDEPDIYFVRLADWRVPAFEGGDSTPIQLAALKALVRYFFTFRGAGYQYWNWSERTFASKELFGAVLDLFTPDEEGILPFTYIHDDERRDESDDDINDNRLSDFFDYLFDLIYLSRATAGSTDVEGELEESVRAMLQPHRERVLLSVFKVAPWRLLCNAAVDPEHVKVLEGLFAAKPLGASLREEALFGSRRERNYIVTSAEMLAIIKARQE